MSLYYFQNQDNYITDQLNQHSIITNQYNTALDKKDEITLQMEILQLHGVSTPFVINQKNVKRRKLKYRNIYLLAVFQQKIIGMFKQRINKKDNWVNNNIFQTNEDQIITKVKNLANKREERRVKNIAIHAVYALNLDYALVKIGVTAGDIPWVLSVNPSSQNKTIKQMFDEEIKAFSEEWDKHLEHQTNNVNLGADPEFVLKNLNGDLVLASKYLPRKGIVGCDDIWTNSDRTQLPLAEIRPRPANDPRKLAINLYKGLILANRKINNRQLQWLAGAMPIEGFPLGGHIHFSNIWLNSFLLRALDNYLTLIITLFEDEKGISRRPKYGFLGDYREQFHGGFEYRTLPSWIVSPTVTKGVFALSKLIAENYTYLYNNPLENLEIQRAYYHGDKEKLKPVVKDLWVELKQLKDYELYKSYLNPIEKLIKENYTWNEQLDIRKAWRLPPYQRRS